jgi:hypothetical protein
MSLDVKLLREEKGDSNFLRVLDYRVGSGPWTRLLPSWNNELIPPSRPAVWWTPIVEIFAPITLQDLREIDNDAVKQANFIKRYLTARGGAQGLPVIKLLVSPTDHVSEKDIEYLVHLMPPPGCIVPTAPLVYRFHLGQTGRIVEDGGIDPSRYLTFADSFVRKQLDGGANILGLTMPSNFSHNHVEALLRVYKDCATPLAIIDAFGQSTREKYAQIKALIGVGKTPTGGLGLQQKHGKNFALYAFDTKPYSGIGDMVTALNALQLNNGFSSVGPRHTVKMMVKRRKNAPPKPPRILVPKDIAYARATVPGALADLRQFCQNEKGGSVSDAEALSLRRRHENYGLIRISKDMADWALSGELANQLKRRQNIAKDLGLVKRRNVLILTKPLD